MEKEKPYLEPKLSLGQLAEMLGVAANKLSQVINQYEEKNFYDFVNGYRVQEFIVRAQNDKNKNLSLLGIAYGSGFNSKSSFNQVFKKFMGETPHRILEKARKLEVECTCYIFVLTCSFMNFPTDKQPCQLAHSSAYLPTKTRPNAHI